MPRTPKVTEPKIFNVVTVAGDGVLETTTMSEPELIAWSANNKIDHKIYDGTEYQLENNPALVPIGVPTQEPVKRKYTRKPKATPPAPEKPQDAKAGAK